MSHAPTDDAADSPSDQHSEWMPVGTVVRALATALRQENIADVLCDRCMVIFERLTDEQRRGVELFGYALEIHSRQTARAALDAEFLAPLRQLVAAASSPGSGLARRGGPGGLQATVRAAVHTAADRVAQLQRMTAIVEKKLQRRMRDTKAQRAEMMAIHVVRRFGRLEEREALESLLQWRTLVQQHRAELCALLVSLTLRPPTSPTQRQLMPMQEFHNAVRSAMEVGENSHAQPQPQSQSQLRPGNGSFVRLLCQTLPPSLVHRYVQFCLQRQPRPRSTVRAIERVTGHRPDRPAAEQHRRRQRRQAQDRAAVVQLAALRARLVGAPWTPVSGPPPASLPTLALQCSLAVYARVIAQAGDGLSAPPARTPTAPAAAAVPLDATRAACLMLRCQPRRVCEQQAPPPVARLCSASVRQLLHLCRAALAAAAPGWCAALMRALGPEAVGLAPRGPTPSTPTTPSTPHPGQTLHERLRHTLQSTGRASSTAPLPSPPSPPPPSVLLSFALRHMERHQPALALPLLALRRRLQRLLDQAEDGRPVALLRPLSRALLPARPHRWTPPLLLPGLVPPPKPVRMPPAPPPRAVPPPPPELQPSPAAPSSGAARAVPRRRPAAATDPASASIVGHVPGFGADVAARRVRARLAGDAADRLLQLWAFAAFHFVAGPRLAAVHTSLTDAGLEGPAMLNGDEPAGDDRYAADAVLSDDAVLHRVRQLRWVCALPAVRGAFERQRQPSPAPTPSPPIATRQSARQQRLRASHDRFTQALAAVEQLSAPSAAVAALRSFIDAAPLLPPPSVMSGASWSDDARAALLLVAGAARPPDDAARQAVTHLDAAGLVSVDWALDTLMRVSRAADSDPDRG